MPKDVSVYTSHYLNRTCLADSGLSGISPGTGKTISSMKLCRFMSKQPFYAWEPSPFTREKKSLLNALFQCVNASNKMASFCTNTLQCFLANEIDSSFSQWKQCICYRVNILFLVILFTHPNMYLVLGSCLERKWPHCCQRAVYGFSKTVSNPSAASGAGQNGCAAWTMSHRSL